MKKKNAMEVSKRLSSGSAAHNKVGLLTFIVVLSLTVTPADFGYCDQPLTSANFLTISFDARGNALGDGGSAFASGAASAFYNPANLSTVEEISLQYDFGNLRREGFSRKINTASVSFAINLEDFGTWGINYNRIAYPDHTVLGERGEYLFDFRPYDYSLGLFNAFDISSDYSVGFGLKYLYGSHWEIRRGYSWDYSSWSLDAGFRVKNLFSGATYKGNAGWFPEVCDLLRARSTKGFSVSTSAANIGPDIDNAYLYKTYKWPIPRTFRLGIGYQAIDSDILGLRLTVDAAKLLLDMRDSFETEWQEINWHYGFEAAILYVIAFRGGRQLDRTGWASFKSWGVGFGPEWLNLNITHISYDKNRYIKPVADEGTFYSLNCNLPTSF